MKQFGIRTKIAWGLSIAACSALGAILLSFGPKTETKVALDQVVPVLLLNGWDLDYIWVDRNVHATVWESGADAGYDPVAGATGTLVLPDNPLGNGFQVPEQETAQGHVSFPASFDIGRPD